MTYDGHFKVLSKNHNVGFWNNTTRIKSFKYLHRFKVSINSKKLNSNKKKHYGKKIKIKFQLIKVTTEKING